MKLNESYVLKEIYKFDDMYDYSIFYENKNIGVLQLRNHESLFIRNIEIINDERRKNHATNIIDALLNYYDKTISLCISMHSISAINFWNKYFINKNVKNIKGNIYEISTTLD